MRKLTSGNKRGFAVFAIIIIGIVAILVWCLIRVLQIPKEEYVIEKNNFLYDEAYNPVLIEDDSIIQKKWDGNYYLKEMTTKEEYKLGTQSIAYHAGTKSLNMYGDMYRIHTDGKVSKITDNTVIYKISEDQLYKIGDRKYMIIGKNIANQTGTLSTTSYLLILIDKAGNTYLLNNELNSKTIKPMIISTQTFKFDVANEKLIYKDNEIDLKKIIGSTNQYVQPDNTIKIEDLATDIQNNIDSIQNNITYMQGDITSIQTNISDIKNDQEDKEGGPGTVISNNNNNGAEKTDLAKSVTLRSATASSTYIDVEYNVVDPENKYQTVYLMIDGAGVAETIALDKDENTYRVTGLVQNQEYKVTLASKQLNSKGQAEETIEDIIVARTTKLSSSLDITKITLSKIYFNLMIDKNQNIDYAEIVLYIDGEEKERARIDTDKATSATGWTSYLDYYYGEEILLKVENASYNDNKINIDIETKSKKY